MEEVYHLIIIGGGPGGLTAGIYAGRQKIKTLLITKDFGGQVAEKAVEIENYPGFEKISGLELINKMKEQVKSQEDVKVVLDEVVRVEKKEDEFLVKTKEKKEYRAYSVIVASGADPRPLEIPGEKEFLGKGVSYCTTCDGPLFSGKQVVVIGGGNAGFESAIYLAKIARKVYILEYGKEVKASPIHQKRIKEMGNAEVITNVAIKEIQGKDFVEGVVYQQRDTGKTFILPADGVFIQIGRQPATSFVKGLADFNQRDEIVVVPETYQTKTPGLFAAGDCNQGAYKQIVIAAGEGAKAALAAYDFLKENKKI